MQTRRQLMKHGAWAMLANIALPDMASAQGAAGWPQKTLRLIVGFPAGTSPDLMARALAEPLAQALGQAVIVENRAGASGSIAAEAVAKATDEHSFGLIGNAALTANPILYANLPYKVSDFAPITVVGSAPLIVVATNSIKFDQPAQFFEQARQSGGRWSYGSVGVGSGTHLSNEMLMAQAGFNAVHVPFNGAPAVLNAMIAGDVQMATLPIGAALAQVNAGRVRGVALTSATRSILAPNLPALLEAGVKPLSVELWNAVMAPASTSKAVLDRFSQALARVIRSEELRQKLFQQGWRAEGTSPEALQRRIKDDTALYAAIIAQRKITVAG